MRLIQTLEVENELGEGVIWDYANAKVWWTDIQKSILYRYDPESLKLEHWTTPERLACFAPRANGKGLIAAFESGFAFYSPESGKTEWIKKLEIDNPGTRFNDGRTDRQGRFWAGTMVEDKDTATAMGSLYCLNHDLSVTKTIEGLSIPNSLAWSPDGKTMYHTDTPSQRINSYHYDTEKGTFDCSKILTSTDKDCYPDGSVVDSDGFLWNAQWGGSKVVRYSLSGQEDLRLEIPTSQPSCLSFGGRDLNLLFVTSAWQGLDEHARSTDLNAGNLFIYETTFKGVADSGFIET